MAEDTPDGDDLSAAALREEMAEREPYTIGELAARLDAPRRRVRELLERLAGEDEVRTKETDPERTLWIREPPARECGACGYRYEIAFLHPVMGSARYCPHCGQRL